MITLPRLAAEALGSFLASDMKDRFGSSHARLAEIIPFAARLALDCIGNSVDGLTVCTAMYFVPSVTCALQGHSHRLPAPTHIPEASTNLARLARPPRWINDLT
jgi:hypothetical protein